MYVPDNNPDKIISSKAEYINPIINPKTPTIENINIKFLKGSCMIFIIII